MSFNNVEELMTAVDEMKQKIAVDKALIAFLRTRYVSVDGNKPKNRISFERSFVTEEVVEEVIMGLTSCMEAREKLLEATLKGEVANGNAE